MLFRSTLNIRGVAHGTGGIYPQGTLKRYEFDSNTDELTYWLRSSGLVGLFILPPVRSQVSFEVCGNGISVPASRIFLGDSATHPPSNIFNLFEDESTLALAKPFSYSIPPVDFPVHGRLGRWGTRKASASGESLDREKVEQLRALGYIR